jgi:molybdenum cofactor cytidylyltransferase
MTQAGATKASLAAVLLAGGASRRFGAHNKLLAVVDGVPMVRRVAQQILAAGIADVIVVTGAEHDAYVQALYGLPVRFVLNPAWGEGMGGSIAAGVRLVGEDVDGVFIVPGDLPNLTDALFGTLAHAFEANGGGKVVVPVTADGAQRNPVLWPRSAFAALAALSGAKGGKSLLDTLGAKRLDVAFDDATLFADIDTQADFDRYTAEA